MAPRSLPAVFLPFILTPLPGSLLAAETTVLCHDRTVRIQERLADPTDLWVTPADLTRINGFVLKPEGACLDSLCVPINQDADNDLLVHREGQKWLSVTELARKLDQAWVVDHDTSVWSFGQIPSTRSAFLDSARAPDFTLPDRQGNPVSLSDFRGKKVLLLSWASW